MADEPIFKQIRAVSKDDILFLSVIDVADYFRSAAEQFAARPDQVGTGWSWATLADWCTKRAQAFEDIDVLQRLES